MIAPDILLESVRTVLLASDTLAFGVGSIPEANIVVDYLTQDRSYSDSVSAMMPGPMITIVYRGGGTGRRGSFSAWMHAIQIVVKATDLYSPVGDNQGYFSLIHSIVNALNCADIPGTDGAENIRWSPATAGDGIQYWTVDFQVTEVAP